MDQQQHISDDHSAMNPSSYGFYGEQEPPFIGYNPQQQIGNYQVNSTRNQLGDIQHQQQHQGSMSYQHLSLISPNQYAPPVYGTNSPPHGSLPLSTSPPPPSPDMYDPLSPPVSGSDTSADGIYHHSNSSGANSPSSSRANSLVHRHVRYNPTPSPTSSSGRNRRGRSQESDEDNDMGAAFVENLANTRKEATRRQRIEAEQRRRDELRDGYAKLKDVLPVSNQKSSKVSLLERATNHIVALEKANKEMLDRLNELEAEMTRLRVVNEKISLGSTETPSPGMYDTKPLEPPGEGVSATTHSLKSVRGQEPPSEDSSPSASEKLVFVIDGDLVEHKVFQDGLVRCAQSQFPTLPPSPFIREKKTDLQLEAADWCAGTFGRAECCSENEIPGGSIIPFNELFNWLWNKSSLYHVLFLHNTHTAHVAFFDDDAVDLSPSFSSLANLMDAPSKDHALLVCTPQP
ncbi:hypothetical protein DXG03_006410 [Asterophora parasitica]|uniref:BHLH domain-containing protein n=1 Tax=Asterophora parasitica TaxID=117018 RepID=A0A9P7GAV1_9AGAR|nr:hypothetical protein DXG03_006410 [Asterophora parasitica]